MKRMEAFRSLPLPLVLLAAPLTADAQQPGKVWRIGFLGTGSPTTPEQRSGDPFLQELQARGYVEGRNLAFERRDAQGRPERLPALAAELVQLNVDVILVVSNPGAHAAKAATATIPLVMINASDPVGQGLVASLAHPGGNVTGVTDYMLDLIPKRLELLKAAVPAVSRVVIVNCDKCAPHTFDAAKIEAVRRPRAAAAKSLGMTLMYVDISGPQDFDNATAAALRAHPDALFLNPGPVNYPLRRELADFAMQHRLPMSAQSRDYAIAGSLMSYGPDTLDMLRHAAIIVDKIFKGAKPGDLPVENPTKFQLVINLKTAKALGLTIPQSLLLRADEVIQ